MKITSAYSALLPILLALFPVLCPTASASADEPPLALGDAMPIPDSMEGDPSFPEVAMAAAGGFVAVWQSLDRDGDGFGVFFQVYDRAGERVGTASQAPVSASGHQASPAVSVADGGSFAVAWEGPLGDTGATVYFRRFAADGTAETGDIPAPENPVDEAAPSLALADDGSLLLVWQGADGDGDGIWARLFGQDGLPLTADLRLNADPAGWQQNPQARAVDDGGGFVVVWEGPDGSGSGIHLRRVSAAGGLVGAEVAVNLQSAGQQRNPSLAVPGLDRDPGGENFFVVAWQSQSGAGTRIFARPFGIDGEPLSEERPVSPDDGVERSHPAVAIDCGGDDDGIDFVITWTQAPVEGLSGLPSESPVLLRGRRMGISDLTGADASSPPASAFTINEPGSTPASSTVAAQDDGDFVVLWQIAGEDDPARGVYGRRFAGQPIFVDGFESGDTSRWGVGGPDPNEPPPTL